MNDQSLAGYHPTSTVTVANSRLRSKRGGKKMGLLFLFTENNMQLIAHVIKNKYIYTTELNDPMKSHAAF